MSSGHGEAGANPLLHGDDHEEHEEHVNHEAWVIPYADLLTLLMALFIVLWATSSQNEAKFAAAAESLRESFSSGLGENSSPIAEGSPGILDGQQTGVEGGDYDQAKAPDEDPITPLLPIANPAESAQKREEAREAAKAAQQSAFDDIRRKISEAAEANGLSAAIAFRQETRGLVVSIIADPVLFEPGSADLKPQGRNILTAIAPALIGAPNDVMVEGHTDNTPINTARYPTNWELSSQRGTSVLRFMTESLNFNPNRVASAGYGETKPLASNETAGGKAANRRVEIVVMAAPIA